MFNVLLQVLDDGRLTDGQGRTVDFRNVLIVMTSNLGSEFLVNLGEGEDTKAVEKEVMTMVRGHFRPEFLNRVDEIILFHRLRREDMGDDRRYPVSAAQPAPRGSQDNAQPRRQGTEVAGGEGLRSDLRRASAEAGDPEMGAGPARAGIARRRDSRRVDRQDQRRARRIDRERQGGRRRTGRDSEAEVADDRAVSEDVTQPPCAGPKLWS